jgi:hypothetical protein
MNSGKEQLLVNFSHFNFLEQIQKDLQNHQTTSRDPDNMFGSGEESWDALAAEERVTRVNEVVFAILSSLQ